MVNLCGFFYLDYEQSKISILLKDYRSFKFKDPNFINSLLKTLTREQHLNVPFLEALGGYFYQTLQKASV